MPTVGCSADHWWRARRNGRWETLSRRVLALVGTEPSDVRRVHAAVLDAGGSAALHGCSSLAWFGQRGFDLSTIHVSRTRGGRKVGSALAVVHQLRDVRPGDIVVVRGVATMSPLRAIWSEASRYGSERRHEQGLARIGRLLDDAHRDGLVTWSALHRAVGDLQRSGRSGTRIMRALADDRPPGSSPTESRNEQQLESILDEVGDPPLLRQVVVGGQDVVGRVDHRDPDLPLVIETNSLTFHTTPSDRAADEARYRAIVEAGFTIAVVWDIDLWSHRRSVVDTVRAARRRAQAGCPAVLHSASCPWPFDPERIVVGVPVPASRG